MTSIHVPWPFSASNTLHERPYRVHRYCRFPNQLHGRISNRHTRVCTGTFAYWASSRPKRADCSLDSRGHLLYGLTSVASCYATVQRQSAPTHDSERPHRKTQQVGRQRPVIVCPTLRAVQSIGIAAALIRRFLNQRTGGFRHCAPLSKLRRGLITFVHPYVDTSVFSPANPPGVMV